MRLRTITCPKCDRQISIRHSGEDRMCDCGDTGTHLHLFCVCGTMWRSDWSPRRDRKPRKARVTV